MVRNPVQKCRCHFGIAKDRHPLPELQIGCNDDAGLFIKLADEMEQQRPARFWERDVNKTSGSILNANYPPKWVNFACLFTVQAE